MNTEHHRFFVRGKSPPTIEVDPAAKAVYVRFKSGKVAKTVSQKAQLSNVAIDLDENDEVIGIEAIGFLTFSIHGLLKMASVEAPPDMDFSRAEYSNSECVPA